MGGYLTKIHYHSQNSSHYRHLNVKIIGFSGVVTSPVNDRTNHLRYEFQLDQVISRDSIIAADGKIYLYVKKDSTTSPLSYGDKVYVSGNYFPISAPGNPGEFNYKKYLARQNIYGHAFVNAKDIRISGRVAQNLLMEWSLALRNRANRIIDRCIPQPRENGIAKALLLGIKDYLDSDLKKAYSAAGAMHVLAVSGLHVGIVFLLIKVVFGRLKETGKWGTYFFGIISVSTIWMYAIVTGLSPSVLRAAVMFSLVALSEASVRDTNIYNSLGIAAFILLLFDPYLIYSVGFQLSFAAVFGIVYLQPKIYRIIEFRYSILDKAWAITCVSIAAQVATFPLTAHYFHQFPTYFLISNLVVIPASFCMLLGGLIMLMADLIHNLFSQYIGMVLQKFMWLVNELISYIHQLPYSLIEWINLDFPGLILTYAIVITLITGLHYGIFRTLAISSSLFILLLGWNWKDNERQSRKKELIFYELKDRIAIDYINGHSATLYLDVESLNELEIDLLSFQIDPYRLSSNLGPTKSTTTTFRAAGFYKKDVIRFGKVANKRILLFDSTTFHLDFKQKIDTDYIVVNNGAIKNLEWLKNNFQFDQVIVSTKNSRYYSKKMKDQAKELDIQIHSLIEDGALRIFLN